MRIYRLKILRYAQNDGFYIVRIFGRFVNRPYGLHGCFSVGFFRQANAVQHLIRHGCAVPPSPQGEGLERAIRESPLRVARLLFGRFFRQANAVHSYCLTHSAYCLNLVRIFRNLRLIDIGKTFTHMLTAQRSVAQIHKARFKERFKFRPDTEIHCDGILKNRVFNDSALLGYE